MPRHVSDECAFVIKGLLKHLPQNRLSIEQIKQTKFLQSRRFSEPLPSYRLRKQKIDLDQLLISCNLRSSSTLQLVSTNDCCKYAKRPVSDGENYGQKQDDNYNYKLASLLTQSKQLQPPTDAVITDNKQKQLEQELNSELNTQIINKGNLSPQSDSGHCDEDSCKSVDNQPSLEQQHPQSINSTTKLNLHYYNDQQYYPSQAVNYQQYTNKNLKPEEDSGVFKSEPKISFKSIENLSPILNDREEEEENSINHTANLNLNNQQMQSKTLNINNQNSVSESSNKNENTAPVQTAAIITRRLSDNKLSADEQETLKRLKQLGITEQMLEENVDSGVRNSLIGIYRLVLHNVIATRLAKEKEEYREIKRKKKLESLQQYKPIPNQRIQQTTQTHLIYEDNRLRKSESVNNGQFYEETGQQIESQSISSKTKSNRLHFSMEDGLEYCARITKEQTTINKLDDEFTLNSCNKLANNETDQMIANDKDLNLDSSSDEDDCSIFSDLEEEDDKDDEFDQDKQNAKNQSSNDLGQHFRQPFNEETNIYNQQFLSKKRTNTIKRKELNELNKQNTVLNEHRKSNSHAITLDQKNETEDYHHMKCDLIDSCYVHHTKINNSSMIINTTNLENNLCKMKVSVNDSKPSDHQPFKPYLNNYLEEEKRWKKQRKKKKKLKKRSVLSCCIF